jgi:hypothetical protein
MALAPSRQVFQTNIKYALNEVTPRGRVVCLVPGTTAAGEVTALANHLDPLTKPVGILLDDVEDLNYDRHPEYRQRSVVDVGSVVGIATEADLETDQLSGTAPVAGNPCYLGAGGTLTPDAGGPLLGWFQSGVNANGFAAVHIDL